MKQDIVELASSQGSVYELTGLTPISINTSLKSWWRSLWWIQVAIGVRGQNLVYIMVWLPCDVMLPKRYKRHSSRRDKRGIVKSSHSLCTGDVNVEIEKNVTSPTN